MSGNLCWINREISDRLSPQAGGQAQGFCQKTEYAVCGGAGCHKMFFDQPVKVLFNSVRGLSSVLVKNVNQEHCIPELRLGNA